MLPSMASTNTNLRQKGSRIQAFATSEPLEDDYQTALVVQAISSDDAPAEELPQEVKPDNIAVRGSAQLSRQQVADSVRMPLPAPIAVKQQTNGHQRDRSTASQRGYGSPSRPRHASPRPTQPVIQPPRPQSRAESSINGLFAGSNLGEDFMRSTMTSPSDDAERNYIGITEVEKENERQDELMRHERTQQRHHPRSRPRQMLKPNDKGYLSIVQQPPAYGFSQYNDGFAMDARRGGRNDFDDEDEHGVEPAAESERQDNPRQPQVALRGERRRLIKPKEDRVVNVTRFEPQRKQSPRKRPEPRQQSPLRQVDNRRPHQYQQSPERRDSQPFSSQPARHYQGPQATDPPVDFSQDSDGQFSDEDIKQVTPKAKKSRDVRVYDEPEEEQTAKQLFTQDPPPRMNKRYRDYGDYQDDALNAMSFSDLKAQPFDFDPSAEAVGSTFNDQVQDLPTKLDQRRRLSEQEQKQFFAAMPVEEWEEAGDWFLQQFGALMQKMRNARREKRKVIGEFEDEAEKREEEVRKRSEGLERKLGRMRQDGAKVIGDAQ